MVEYLVFSIFWNYGRVNFTASLEHAFLKSYIQHASWLAEQYHYDANHSVCIYGHPTEALPLLRDKGFPEILGTAAEIRSSPVERQQCLPEPLRWFLPCLRCASTVPTENA